MRRPICALLKTLRLASKGEQIDIRNAKGCNISSNRALLLDHRGAGLQSHEVRGLRVWLTAWDAGCPQKFINGRRRLDSGSTHGDRRNKTPRVGRKPKKQAPIG
jgi:hypothetical protein